MAKVQAATRRKSDKVWRDALIRALARKAGQNGGFEAGLNEVADKVIELAVGGDSTAIKEIGDRLDGKPMQSTEISGPDGDPIPVGVKVSYVDGSK